MALHSFDRGQAAWWAFGLALAVTLLYVVYSFVGTVVFGIFLYYATRPIYRRLRRRYLDSRTAAAAVALVALTLPAFVLVGYALLVVATELSRLTESATLDPTRIPGVTQELLDTLANPERLLSTDLTAFVTMENLSSLLESLGSAASTVAFFGVGAVHLFVMVAIAFYLLRDDHRLSRWVARLTDGEGAVDAYLNAVDRDFNSIFFGNILNAALTGTIAVIVYSLLNVVAPPGVAIPAAALLGLLAGVASLVPVVGMKLVYVPVALYMGLQALLVGTDTLWFVALFALVSFVVVDSIPDLILRPYVSGRSLHVGTVMLAYTLGPLLFGWYGIFLLPMVLVLTVQFVRIVLPELVRGGRLRPAAVDPGTLAGEELPPEAGEPGAPGSPESAVDGGESPSGADRPAGGTEPDGSGDRKGD